MRPSTGGEPSRDGRLQKERQGHRKNHQQWLEVLALALPQTSCVSLGKSLDLSKPQFLHLKMGNHNSTYLLELYDEMTSLCNVFDTVPVIANEAETVSFLRVRSQFLFVFISPASSTVLGTSQCSTTTVGTKLNRIMGREGIAEKGPTGDEMGRWIEPECEGP